MIQRDLFDEPYEPKASEVFEFYEERAALSVMELAQKLVAYYARPEDSIAATQAVLIRACEEFHIRVFPNSTDQKV